MAQGYPGITHPQKVQLGALIAALVSIPDVDLPAGECAGA